MAHTLDTSATITAGTTNPKTIAYTCGAGATVLVLAIGVGGATARAGGAPTYNGVTLTQADITRKYATSPEASAELWYLLTPPTGTSYTLSIPNTGALSIWGAVVTFKAQTGYGTVLDSAVGNTGATLNPSLSITPAVAGDVMVEVLADGAASVPTARTHTSLATQDWGQYVAAIQYGLIAGSGAVTMEFTIAADDWGMVMAAFKELLPPTAPSNAHEDSKTSVQIVMGWTDNSNNETGFKMYKNDVYIETIAAGSTSYTFIGLSGGVTYDLAVKATNGAGDSAEAQLTDATIANSVIQLNIGDIWKQVNTLAAGTLKINIGDVWKDVVGIQNNVGDVWRKIWPGVLSYYGTATALSSTRYYEAATSIGNYALFGGGVGVPTSDIVDAYDTSLTHSTPTALSLGRYELAAATIGNYALFGGGMTPSASAVVDAYDTSLTRSTPTALSVARFRLAAAIVGNYALFGGGNIASSWVDTVDAYDTSLTRTTPTVLSATRQYLAATSVGNYALFGGGVGSAISAVVDAYDASLTRTTPTVLSVARQSPAATAVGNYALFGGGYSGAVSAVVDAYDASLTRSTPTALSVARTVLKATTVGTYALFGGGGSNSTVVDAYDTSLTRSTPTALSVGRGNNAATTVGSFALFGGGSGATYYNVVDVYTA